MPVKDDDVHVLGVWGDEFVGILVLWDGAHARAGKSRVVEGDEDIPGPRCLGFLEPYLELLHLFFEGGPRGVPRRRRAIVVFAGPQEDEAGAVEIELVNEL